MRRGTVVALAAVLLCSLAAAADGEGEWELQYRRFRRALPPGFDSTAQFLSALPGPPFRMRAPDLDGDAFYFTHVIGGHSLVFLVDAGKEPRLYVDADGDKNLAEETALRGEYETAVAGYVFGVITLPGREPGGDIEFRVRTYGGKDSYRYLFLEPAGVRTGAGEIGGVAHRLRIMDANLDGRYDGVLDPANPYSRDWYVLLESGADAQSAAGLPRPLPRILQVGEDWYSIKVRPDGSGASFAKTDPAFGVLSVGTPSAELRLISDTGAYYLKGTDGEWELPQGRYIAERVVLRAEDENNVPWQLTSSQSTGKLADFAITGAETLELPVGAPLTLKTTVRVDAGERQVYMNVVLAGQSGEEYAPGARRGDQTIDAPSYRILNEKGTELASGRFEYG